MTRSIDIGYRSETSAQETDITVPPPYYLLGTQQTSERFWGLPVLEEIGIRRLRELATTDPIYFWGWDGLAELDEDVTRIRRNLDGIDFAPEVVAQWLSHLTYCHALLVLSTPSTHVPWLSIG